MVEFRRSDFCRILPLWTFNCPPAARGQKAKRLGSDVCCDLFQKYPRNVRVIQHGVVRSQGKHSAAQNNTAQRVLTTWYSDEFPLQCVGGVAGRCSKVMRGS